MEKKPKHANPSYDDDKFYDVESVASCNDCTGLMPTPPKSEAEAESYGDLSNVPTPKGKVNNGFQKTRPGDKSKKT
jgi:hypothetical protein